MKKKLLTAALVSALAAGILSGCGKKIEPIETDPVPPMTDAVTETPVTETPATTEAVSEVATTEVAQPEAQGDVAPVSGTYEVDGINVLYHDNVRNDVTGKWRLAVIADGSDLNNYVADFYKYFVRDDSEIFGIVNLTLRTSTLVTPVKEDWLDITITEYQDGEEHDANALYGGASLGEYWINTKTGEIDNLE